MAANKNAKPVPSNNITRFMEEQSTTPSDDEYLSPASPASPYASRKGFAMHAGHTPGPKGRSTTAGDRIRRLSVDFSGLISQEDIERVIKTGTLHNCLFGTMHVKAATSLLTIFYLLLLAFLDNVAYQARMDQVDYIVFSVVSVSLLVAVLVAQYGLWRERYLNLVPLLIAQLVLGAILYVFYCNAMFAQGVYAKKHPKEIVRVVMLILSEVVAAFLHGYSVLVVIRCMSYLYDKSHNLPELSFENRSFFESLKERVTRRKKANDADEEVVLIDETAAKKDVADKKPKGSSSEEPQRYVHFVDVNTYHDI